MPRAACVQATLVMAAHLLLKLALSTELTLVAQRSIAAEFAAIHMKGLFPILCMAVARLVESWRQLCPAGASQDQAQL